MVRRSHTRRAVEDYYLVEAEGKVVKSLINFSANNFERLLDSFMMRYIHTRSHNKKMSV